ncbi:TPA: hypothetical protein ACJ3D1_004452 [Klebsiella pneumoniae]|nr:hypothetical protein [Klebsiella pneumoniae]HBS0402864.1 hypothetical protein [Klebsiella pneumoniae]
MTDITELAQREKFEAWAEERCALPWGYLKNRRTNTGYFSKHDYTSLWAAWKAAGAELVEALEKAQQHIARQEQIILNQDESLSIRRGELEKALDGGKIYQQSFFRQCLMYDVVAEAYEEAKQRIAEDVEIKARLCRESNSLFDRLRAAENRIAQLESRAVKLPAERFCPAEYAGSQLWSETEVWNKAITACADALRADGFKVEVE